MEFYEKNKDKIIYIQFPKSNTHPFANVDREEKVKFENFSFIDYGEEIGKKIIKLPEGETYYGWYSNHHHFTTKYHMNVVIPMLNEILNFGYNINDFTMNKCVINEFDISMPLPNNEIEYDVISYTDNEILNNIRYTDFLYCGNGNCGQLTEYHKIYRYGHKCSKIINKTINNNRKLLISGDSQMIPSIPILSVYFNEVSFFDNRENKNHFSKQEQNYTDIIFAMGYNNFSKYISNIK